MNAHNTCAWPQGLKRTKSREMILAALEQEPLPLTAQALSIKLQQKNNYVCQSTLYRVLESFVEHKLVLKNFPASSTMAVYELNRHKHHHYAVCVDCHSMVPVAICPLEQLLPAEQDVLLSSTGQDFHVLGHNLELLGYCQKCFYKQQNLK